MGDVPTVVSETPKVETKEERKKREKKEAEENKKEVKQLVKALKMDEDEAKWLTKKERARFLRSLLPKPSITLLAPPIEEEPDDGAPLKEGDAVLAQRGEGAKAQWLDATVVLTQPLEKLLSHKRLETTQQA